ncbi:hypothetical protein [Microbacterium terrisoli]|uniref:hypothetical protein n=1 Tax=Microbacterium terrisoli TaxID=3242192 RepID=UPI002805E413|nr:hypothetical protein [Microbacterium protaetiae]
MNGDRRVLLEVPDDLAAELTKFGLAVELPRVRAGAVEVVGMIGDIAASAAVVVTLLQGSDTLKSLAELLLIRSREKGMVRIRAKGPNGVVDVLVRPETPHSDVEKVVGLVFNSKPDEP